MPELHPQFLTDLKRTHDCGALRATDAGQRVVLFGWVAARRDHGGCVFIDLRDRAGLTQVVFEPHFDEQAHRLAGELRSEFCVGITGVVAERGGHKNASLATGEVEVKADALTIFSTAETPPFEISDDTLAGESVRLKHRYLDLRRPSLQKNFLVRSTIYQTTRRYLAQGGFAEIETPFMVKYTPGGARNFLVPSRLNPGQFYALAESPQIFKQLFMVSGFDRYFQIVRCFRDEDLRLDRQPEFTQIDLEMSFVVEEDVQSVVEGLMAALWKDVLDVEIPRPLPRLTYADAMALYGSDKPDLRFGLPLCDVTAAVRQHQGGGVALLQAAIAQPNGVVKGWRLPAAEASKLSRADLDKLEEFAKGFGARGLARARISAGGVWAQSPMKTISDALRTEINAIAQLAEGDLLFLQFGAPKLVNAVLGGLRLHLATKLDLVPKGLWRFCWITEFPLFEQADDGHLAASHHPFTSPSAADVERLESDPASVRARAYDLVLNGNEIAGGSIRIHRSDLQARVFRALGLSDEDARAKFGFLLEAFKYGPPPHGGIAAGVDRLAMLLCGAESLRDVIAFPKTQKGTDLLTDAPSAVSSRQLDELHISLK
ncbi:MAG TPA: aspartate--tRNA ligase [Polyangia bacterium]|jgi:aspartyl-tRNA synthetase|nr:aspartate--tRNA ligase [Polyangia bacterium]